MPTAIWEILTYVLLITNNARFAKNQYANLRKNPRTRRGFGRKILHRPYLQWPHNKAPRAYVGEGRTKNGDFPTENQGIPNANPCIPRRPLGVEHAFTGH